MRIYEKKVSLIIKLETQEEIDALRAIGRTNMSVPKVVSDNITKVKEQSVIDVCNQLQQILENHHKYE